MDYQYPTESNLSNSGTIQPSVRVGQLEDMTISSTEGALFQRFARKRKAVEEITFEFTKDKGFLHQYFRLREEMFIKVWNLKHFSAAEDEYDSRSHILVARRGKVVVGGVRLVVSSPRVPMLLPMESDDFRLKDQLPELGLENRKIAEISRMAILEDFRDVGLARDLFMHLNRKSLALGVEYLLGLCPFAQARSYRNSYRLMGYDAKIMTQVKIPEREEYEGIRMSLICTDFTPYHAAAKGDAAASAEMV